jgi:hypothetical protein
MNATPGQTDLTAEQLNRYGQANDPRRVALTRLDPASRVALFTVDENRNRFSGTFGLIFNDALTPQQNQEARQSPLYERIRQEVPGHSIPGYRLDNNIAGAATLSINQELSWSNLAGRSFRRLMETGNVFGFISSLYDATLFATGMRPTLQNADNQAIAGEIITRVATETGARLATPPMNMGRNDVFNVMRGVMTAGGQYVGVDMSNSALAQALPLIQSAPPRRASAMNTAPDIVQGPVVSRQQDLSSQLALGAQIRGLEIHAGARRAMAPDGTTPLVSDEFLRSRNEISTGEIMLLVARGRQGQTNPVFERLNNQIEAKYEEIKSRADMRGISLEQFRERIYNRFNNENTSEIRDFRDILYAGNPSGNIAPYLRHNLEADISAGRISLETAQDLREMRTRGVEFLTVAELRADIESRGIVFQRTMTEIRQQNAGLSADDVSARALETLSRELPPASPHRSGNDVATRIARPSPELLDRHSRSIALRAPTEEAVMAVSTLATPEVRRQRDEFVGSEVRALREMILSNPAQFGLTATDERLQRLQNNQFGNPNEHTGIARISLSPEALRAAGIAPENVRVSQAVHNARQRFRVAETQFMRQMPEEITRIFVSDRQTGQQAVAEVLQRLERQHGRDAAINPRLVETDLEIRPVQQLREAVERASTRVSSTLRAPEPRRVGELNTPATSTVTDAEERFSPLDRAREVVAELTGVSPAEGAYGSPAATPQSAKAETQERSASV